MATIPEFDENGNLPPGVYHVSLADMEERFAWNPQRRELLEGLQRALANLALAGVKRVRIGGSFVTAKEEPADVEGCWEIPQPLAVERLDMAFLVMQPPRMPMVEKYGVGFLIAGAELADPGVEGRRVEEFLQRDARGNPKGVLIVDLGAMS